ncbi:MAG TPA: RNA polymerase factor sigma-54, partial [Desulfurivibrionaceae bacterium]|nr:RNA polymerase factor sigma-54 [Desulfurivibrionaceae bacterium]
MALELKQQLKLSQQLIMTPQLQQAIKLLQLSRLELAETIQQEIEENPVLEESATAAEAEQEFTADEAASLGMAEEPTLPEPERTSEVQMESTSSLTEIDWENYANEYESGYSGSTRQRDEGDLPSRLDILTAKPNLQSHLQWQLNLSNITEEEREAGLFIIGNLNRDGFLEATLEDIVRETGCSEETARHMIAVTQEMDPPGVGARDIKECLLLQLARLGLADSLAAYLVRDHLHLLETKNYQAMARATGRPADEVMAAVRIIVNLDPHPGRIYSDEEPQYIVPDVYVYKLGNEYVIMLNDEGLPRLKISNYYKDILKKDSAAPAGTKDYVQDKLRSAMWLIKSIQQRQRTIYRVVESILKFQREFFEKGVAHLRPMVLRDVAEDLSMHESTISRVTSNKYVHTPQG